MGLSFYVHKFSHGKITPTLLSLKGRVFISLTEDQLVDWLFKRKLFIANYKIEFANAIKRGKLRPAYIEDLIAAGFEVDNKTLLFDYYVDTTKTDLTIVSRTVKFPDLFVEVSKEDLDLLRSLSGGFSPVLCTHLGKTSVQIAVYEQGKAPDRPYKK